MFTDIRSKRVMFVAHCVVNQNSISDGTADYPCAHVDIIRALMDAQVGIVQMPCPELCCLGLDRGNIYGAESPLLIENTRIRREMLKEPASARLAMLVDQVMLQIDEYNKHGFTILGIVGINRSPSCGVETTSDNDNEIDGAGVFVAAIQKALAAENLSIPVIGIKSTTDAVKCVKALL
jgi:Predicted secreted protein